MTNRERYATICAMHTQIPVFATEWWMNAVCTDWDVAIASKGGEVLGAWPYGLSSRLGIRLLRTPILTPYAGPVIFYPADFSSRKRDTFEQEVMAELFKQMPDSPVWDVALYPGQYRPAQFQNIGLNIKVRQTYLLGLRESNDALFANMKDTLRRNLRQAEAEMTVTSEPEGIDQLFEFHLATLERKGKRLPYSVADLRRLLEASLANNASKIWVARQDGIPQAIIWQFWDTQRSYYLMGGQNPVGGSYKAMSLLLWTAIRQAKQLGLQQFDFEGSMDEGVERFFRGFGGDRHLYLVLQKNTSPIWRLKQSLGL